ncbi:hypothetical protein AURDEDRAFT_177864 [Auricularia subglabra TFB-10046 SS5]|uniref:Uncharacterized protein n=1 Tax=Auricularia subglabra (strain TFB-10046 / SS5) TaxID=717982 RepID=J0WL70_AURST|nr:hypothetical protein AURDEDRAFT_177864 [Auricularia subglabra TFB-10046 SS5]
MIVFYVKRDGDGYNSAVHAATDKFVEGEYLVLAAQANKARTHYANVRTAWQADRAVELLVDDIKRTGGYPKVVIYGQP